jgi:hypothetical protein
LQLAPVPLGLGLVAVRVDHRQRSVRRIAELVRALECRHSLLE